MVANGLSNHPNDKQEAEPTLDAIDPRLGKPKAAAMDNGYFSITIITACEQRSIEPIIATGKEAHYLNLETLLAEPPEAPDAKASPSVKMSYKLRTEAGQAIYRLRKCTVEPVIGIIKEVLGFRQFSLRGLLEASGEWCLVCLAFNLKRLHTTFPGARLLVNLGLFRRAFCSLSARIWFAKSANFPPCLAILAAFLLSLAIYVVKVRVSPTTC